MSSPLNSRCGPSRPRTNRGSAIITVLVLAAVTAVISAGFLSRSAQEAKMATRSLCDAIALNLAEAGVEEGLFAVNSAALNSTNGWSLATGSSTDYVKSITSGFTFQQATGAIYVRVDGATGATPTITSAAVVSIPNQPKIVKQLRIGSTGPRHIWSNGIVSKGAVTFSGSADIDAYDSSLGPYNASLGGGVMNRTDKATVASDTTVTITGAAYVYGYVATGGSAPNVGGSGRIYGATSPSSPLIDPSRVRTDFNMNLTDATAPTTAAISLGSYSIGGVTAATLPRAGDSPGANGRYLYVCTSMSVGASGHLTIDGPVDIIVTGATTVSGAAYVAIGGGTSSNPSLNLYGAGDINFGGSGMVNNTSAPANATIWGTAPSGTTQTVSISGASAFKGTIYAPNGNVSITGSGGNYGAVVGKTVTLSGAGVLHYDTALANLVTSAGPSPASGATNNGALAVSSWAELTGAPSGGSAFARDNRAPFNTIF